MTARPDPTVTCIDICICTFRRPHVAETLKSIAVQAIPASWRLRVIVADNDEVQSARKMVETAARQYGIPLAYVHAPARNISRARNACLDAATAPFIAFIDDDELASPGWLSALMKEMENSGADAVLGPVRAIYRPECPAWIREADFHSTAPTWVNGKIASGATGNVLMKRASIQGLRFREDLGRCGGEDTAFFREMTSAGGRLAFAPDALATELVPKERESFGWLLRRRFRYGQTHGLMLLESTHETTLRRAGGAVAAALKAVFCIGMAALHAPRRPRGRFWFLRGALHAGVTCRLLGKREGQQYG